MMYSQLPVILFFLVQYGVVLFFSIHITTCNSIIAWSLTVSLCCGLWYLLFPSNSHIDCRSHKLLSHLSDLPLTHTLCASAVTAHCQPVGPPTRGFFTFHAVCSFLEWYWMYISGCVMSKTGWIIHLPVSLTMQLCYKNTMYLNDFSTIFVQCM